MPYDLSDSPHVLAIGNDGYIYAYNENDGSSMSGFPLNTRILSKSSLAAVDLDNDGDLELINGNYLGLSVTDLKQNIGDVHWPMHRGSADRCGCIKTNGTGIKDIDELQDLTFELIGNYPNPFNPNTTIRYRINNSLPVSLNIYSLDGRLVMTRRVSSPEYGLNEININMENYSSGIYLYTIESGDETRRAKMIYLK